MEFAEILKEIMEERSLTQVKLADIVGIKQSQVSEWLNGKAKPGYDNLKLLSEKLDIEADVLLGKLVV